MGFHEVSSFGVLVYCHWNFNLSSSTSSPSSIASGFLGEKIILCPAQVRSVCAPVLSESCATCTLYSPFIVALQELSWIFTVYFPALAAVAGKVITLSFDCEPSGRVQV